MAAFETLIQDLRYGIRGLGRAPAFTCAALLTLALGIGANTAIFSVVHAVLLEPLPYPEPDRIVQLVRRTPRSVDEGQTGRRYLFFRDHLKSVESLAAWRGPSGINLVHGDAAEFVRATPVSREFFDVIGVRPALGSVFAAEHDRAGGPPAVILTHGLWISRFGADPSIVGAALLLGGRSHVVIGIMPAGFTGLEPSDVFVPLQPSLTGPGGGFNYAVARTIATRREGCGRKCRSGSRLARVRNRVSDGDPAQRASVRLHAAASAAGERRPSVAADTARRGWPAARDCVRQHRQPSPRPRVGPQP